MLAWGANSHGQLSTGDREDVEAVGARVDVEGVRQVCGGAGHTLLLKDDGSLFSCGWNSSGQLGIGHSKDSLMFQRVEEVPSFTSVSCGWNHSLAIDGHGQVWTFGEGRYGQCGPGVAPRTVPTRIPIEGKVVQVDAGLRHSAAITEAGELFVWGEAKHGQIGEQLKSAGSIVEEPTKIILDARVDQVCCGYRHTVALSRERNALFSSGCNKYGQRMRDESDFQATTHTLGRIMMIACGWNHCVASVEGDGGPAMLYAWGRADYGQLGNSGVVMDRSKVGRERVFSGAPVHIEMPFEWSVTECSVVCGSEHSLALDRRTGSVFAWGWNEHGMCGGGGNANVMTPECVVQTGATQIGIGAGHSIVVMGDA